MYNKFNFYKNFSLQESCHEEESETYFTAQGSKNSYATSTSESKVTGAKPKVLTKTRQVAENQTNKAVYDVTKKESPPLAKATVSPKVKKTIERTDNHDIIGIVQKIRQNSLLNLQKKLSSQRDVNDVSLPLPEASIQRKSGPLQVSSDNTRDQGKYIF